MFYFGKCTVYKNFFLCHCITHMPSSFEHEGKEPKKFIKKMKSSFGLYKNVYKCTLCEYIGRRGYHARMHVKRIHINGGRPMPAKLLFQPQKPSTKTLPCIEHATRVHSQTQHTKTPRCIEHATRGSTIVHITDTTTEHARPGYDNLEGDFMTRLYDEAREVSYVPVLKKKRVILTRDTCFSQQQSSHNMHTILTFGDFQIFNA